MNAHMAASLEKKHACWWAEVVGVVGGPHIFCFQLNLLVSSQPSFQAEGL